MMDHSTRAHSLYGGSQMARIIQCPGSVALVRDLPPLPPSPYAAEGTRMHEYAQRALCDQTYASADLNAEERDGLDYYVTIIRNHLHRTAAAGLLVEYGFEFPDLHSTAHGTIDAAIYAHKERKLYVFDLKWGKGKKVSALDNAQLRTYAFGLALHLLRSGERIEQIEMTIVQPRVSNRISMTRDTLLGLADYYLTVLRPAVVASEQPNAPLREGSECWFCAARAHDVCPLVRAKRDAAAIDGFAPVPDKPW